MGEALRKWDCSRLGAAENGGSATNGVSVTPSMERGDQSEDKAVTGKEGSVMLFSQGRGRGVGEGAVKGVCCLLHSWSQGDPM